MGPKVHFAQVQLHSCKPDLEFAYSRKKKSCEPIFFFILIIYFLFGAFIFLYCSFTSHTQYGPAITLLYSAQTFILHHFLMRHLTNASPLITLAMHLCVIISSTVRHMTLIELLHSLLMEKRIKFF